MIIHDDCLFHILSFIDPVRDLLKNCILVSEQWNYNAKRVLFDLDFSGNLNSYHYHVEFCKNKKAYSLIQFNLACFFSCQYLTSLKSLNLSFNNIGCNGAKLLAECEYLTHLNELILHGCNILSEGVEYLVRAPTLITNLTKLNLSRCGLGDDGLMKLLQDGSKIQNLKHLYLASNGISVEGFNTILCNLPKCLKVLNVRFNNFEDEFEFQKDLIPESSELEEIDLSQSHTCDEHLEIISEKFKKLKKLSLQAYTFNSDFRIFEKFTKLSFLDISYSKTMLPNLHYLDNLKTIILNSCRLPEFYYLEDDTFLPSLESLSIDQNPLNTTNIIQILKSAKRRGISVVEFDAQLSHYSASTLEALSDFNTVLTINFALNNGISDQVLSRFKTIHLHNIPPIIDNSYEYLKNVKSIDIYHLEIKDEGFRLIYTNNTMKNLDSLTVQYCNIQNIPSPEECHSNLLNLTYLSVANNYIQDEGVKKIINNPYLSNLRTLEIPMSGITIESVNNIVSSPYMKNLTSLDLDGNEGVDRNNYGIKPNQIGDEGFKILLNSNLNNLTYLCVSGNGLGNESAKCLPEHQGLKNLVELIMFDNFFNDEAIPYLSSPRIRKFHTLRILYHQITEEGVAQIEESEGFKSLFYSI